MTLGDVEYVQVARGEHANPTDSGRHLQERCEGGCNSR